MGLTLARGSETEGRASVPTLPSAWFYCSTFRPYLPFPGDLCNVNMTLYFPAAGAHNSIFPQNALPHLDHQHSDAFVAVQRECHLHCEAFCISYNPCLGGPEHRIFSL